MMKPEVKAEWEAFLAEQVNSHLDEPLFTTEVIEVVDNPNPDDGQKVTFHLKKDDQAVGTFTVSGEQWMKWAVGTLNGEPFEAKLSSLGMQVAVTMKLVE